MTPAGRIRAAVAAVWDTSPVPPTADDLAAAVCEALADVVVPTIADPRLSTVRSDILRIARDLRGELSNG